MSNKAKENSIILVCSIIILIIGYILLREFSKVTGTICLIRGTVGIPCPTCGITRAINALIHGNVRLAFMYHPLFWLPIVIAVLVVYIYKTKTFKIILIISIIAIIMLYIIRMTLLFPDQEPMKYNNNSLIQKIFNNKL